VLRIEDILKFLPHRFPFLLVDRVLSLEPEKSIVAVKNVTCNESFFQGHFPEVKIMPGVLIIEALAQAGGVLIYNSLPDPKKKLIVLSKIEKAKFRKAVVPGDQLRLEVEVIKLRTRLGHVRSRALVGGEVVAEAEITAGILDLEEAHAPR
jgi:3-hydroxyacyl-[acyl-carrier-protein] dehydratase/UDP-3-O-[3-hydroxymyristoyl] N-acetylglucosamine deacetylase/3-hydroxyacyl-[acyl-carrier-protein] dehydratase